MLSIIHILACLFGIIAVGLAPCAAAIKLGRSRERKDVFTLAVNSPQNFDLMIVERRIDAVESRIRDLKSRSPV